MGGAPRELLEHKVLAALNDLHGRLSLLHCCPQNLGVVIRIDHAHNPL